MRLNPSMDDQQLQAYAAALDRNPMDPVARIALAEALYKQGDLPQAIEHLEWTLRQFPRLSSRLKIQLEVWQRELARGGLPMMTVCHRCYAENLPGVTRCEQCGESFGARQAIREQVQRDGGLSRVARGYIVTFVSIFLIGFAMFWLWRHSILLAAALIGGTIITATWLFLRWVGGDMGTLGD